MTRARATLESLWERLRGLASSALAWVLGIRRDPNDLDNDGSTG